MEKVRILKLSKGTAVVRRPELTTEERAWRMERIEKAAAQVLKAKQEAERQQLLRRKRNY